MVLSGDFINHSTQNLTWNTAAADLVFTNVPAGSLNHLLSLPGADLGQTRAGYSNNFAWGSLDLTNQTLTLADGNDTPGGAFYVGSILGVTLDGGKVTDIFGQRPGHLLQSGPGGERLPGRPDLRPDGRGLPGAGGEVGSWAGAVKLPYRPAFGCS